jgi:hypothetical protein
MRGVKMTEYNSEMAEIIFGLVFFVATMSAVLLPVTLTTLKLSKVSL